MTEGSVSSREVFEKSASSPSVVPDPCATALANPGKYAVAWAEPWPSGDDIVHVLCIVDVSDAVKMRRNTAQSLDPDSDVLNEFMAIHWAWIVDKQMIKKAGV